MSICVNTTCTLQENMQAQGLKLANVIFASLLVRPLPYILVYDGIWATKPSFASTAVFLSDLVTHLRKVIYINSRLSSN
jgi:hypothetical protein